MEKQKGRGGEQRIWYKGEYGKTERRMKNKMV